MYWFLPQIKPATTPFLFALYRYEVLLHNTLLEELSINSGTNLDSTYVNQDRTVDEIIQTHASTLEDIFDIKLQQKEKNLPQIYWIPKLHKTPYKARFITGSSSCTITRLSKLITECLKLVRRRCTTYCRQFGKGQVLKACGSSIIRWTLSMLWRKNNFSFIM